jgi:hypothetical protein
MNLPKVQFTNIPIDQEVDWLHGFLFQNKWGWEKYIIKKHPYIKKVYSYKKEGEQINFLKKYVTDYNSKNKEAIEQNIQKYEQEWQKIEKEFFTELSNIIQINWPANKKNIKAMTSINPICPRFLDEWSFTLFFNYKKTTHAMETIMHESCHFLYFEKWQQIYPAMDAEKFESPHIEWHLSEIVAPIILNDKRIQKLLKQQAFFYEEHQKIKIENKAVPDYFTQLYKKEKENFEKFLKKSYSVIQENKNSFLNI